MVSLHTVAVDTSIVQLLNEQMKGNDEELCDADSACYSLAHFITLIYHESIRGCLVFLFKIALFLPWNVWL